MKKNLITLSLIGLPIISIAGTYNVIIGQNNNNYKIEANYVDTGNKRCAVSTPLENEVYKYKSFTQNHSGCEKEQKRGEDIRWIPINDYSENKEGTLLLNNCSQILDGNHSNGDGIYPIINNNSEIEVRCDMTTNGGGWTLVAYAGTIHTNKKTTTGNTAFSTYLPLFFNFKNYEKDAPTNKKSFSRFDLFKENANVGDEFMAKRTSNSNKIMIFPLTHKEWWGRNPSEGHFAINNGNRAIPYLKLTNSGNNGWKTVSNDTDWYVFNGGRGSDTYPGIDWNRPEGDNSHYGNDFNTNLSHRVLLYWESEDNDGNYTKDQWFHAQPLQMADPGEPDNNIQDIEFWYRSL